MFWWRCGVNIIPRWHIDVFVCASKEYFLQKRLIRKVISFKGCFYLTCQTKSTINFEIFYYTYNLKIGLALLLLFLLLQLLLKLLLMLQLLKLIYNICRMLGFEPEILWPQTGVLPMNYTHPLSPNFWRRWMFILKISLTHERCVRPKMDFAAFLLSEQPEACLMPIPQQGFPENKDWDLNTFHR